MATALHTIIALEKTAKSEGQGALGKAYHTLQKTPLLTGLSKTYEPVNEDGEGLPAETQRVQVRTADVIKETTEKLSRMFDVVATKETTNTVAHADIVVDERIIADDVPVGVLLWLEKQLVNLHTFVSKLPTLDPAEDWHWSANNNVYATDASQKVRTVKVQYPLVMAPATDKHPAQVVLAAKDVTAGTWTTYKFSGAIPAEDVARLTSKVEALQRAVKVAREEANGMDVIENKIGPKVFGFIFG